MTRALLCLVLLGAVDATAALAQPAPAVDKTKVAAQYVEAGIAAQSSGDYDTAITFYSKAYQLVPHPTLIFNIAQAHRLAGHTEQALSLYRRYLSESPDGEQATTARELVTEIEKRKADEARKAAEARKAEEDRKLAEARKAEEDRKAAEARKAREQAVAQRVPGETTPEASGAAVVAPVDLAPAEPGRTQRLVGLATGVGGAVTFAIGIGFGLYARGLSNELSRRGAVYDPDKVHSGERANALAIAGLAGGTALIAIGAVMYWRGYTLDHGDHVSLAPMLSQHTAGLVVSGALP